MNRSRASAGSRPSTTAVAAVFGPLRAEAPFPEGVPASPRHPPIRGAAQPRLPARHDALAPACDVTSAATIEAPFERRRRSWFSMTAPTGRHQLSGKARASQAGSVRAVATHGTEAVSRPGVVDVRQVGCVNHSRYIQAPAIDPRTISTRPQITPTAITFDGKICMTASPMLGHR